MAVVAAFATPAPADVAPCRPTWGSVPSFGANGFVAVDAISSSDIWAVGKSALTSPVAHFNGTGWSLVSAPQHRHRTAVEAVAPNDIWTVARDSTTGPVTIEHLDGLSWSATPMPPGIDIADFASAGPNDVWAVGAVSDGTGTRTSLTENWDGTGWHVVPNVPRTELATTYTGFTSVAAVAPDDVWAVGTRAASADARTLIEHWDGNRWTLVPGPPGNSLEGVSAASANDVWAVGSTELPPFQAVVEHWDGVAWSLAPIPQPGLSSRLHAVAAVSPDDVWAVGEMQPETGPTLQTLTMHWDGTSWSVIGPLYGDRRFMSVTATDDGEAAAAGGALYDLCSMQVRDEGFQPSAATKVQLGVPVAWKVDVGGHGVRDGLGLGLFDSGARAAGGSFTYAFPAAGAFPVVDPVDGQTATITVSMHSAGRQIMNDLTSAYTIDWGLGIPPPGAVYDVQLQRFGGRYADYLVGTTMPGLTFAPGTLGCTCSVRARLRSALTGAASGWSPSIRIDP